LNCPLNLAEVNITRLGPPAEWFAEVRTALKETKAVSSVFSGPIHENFLNENSSDEM